MSWRTYTEITREPSVPQNFQQRHSSQKKKRINSNKSKHSEVRSGKNVWVSTNKDFFLVIIFLISLAGTIHPSCTPPVLQGRQPSLPSGISVELTPIARECLIYLSSLPKFVFLLPWLSRCWNKHEQKSSAWLRLHLLWWELFGTSGRPKPGPPNSNLLKPGLALSLEISHDFVSLSPT